MALELITPRPEHAPELARICFDAFGTLHDRHRIPRDFLSPEMALGMMEMLVRSPSYAGVAAVVDGELAGSNFVSVDDPVAGVGPITVDPRRQARGLGRALMQAVMDLARDRGVARVRLFQEAVNATSLSLYTALGFAWRDSAALLELRPGASTDGSVRDLRPGDIAAADALCVANYGHSRRREIESTLSVGFPAYVRERRGRVTGYLLPGFMGHGMMETDDDALALLAHAAGRTPPMFQRVLCPLSESALFRRALADGHRTLKVFSYMSLGPFEPPQGTWFPSIGC